MYFWKRLWRRFVGNSSFPSEVIQKISNPNSWRILHRHLLRLLFPCLDFFLFYHRLSLFFLSLSLSHFLFNSSYFEILGDLFIDESDVPCDAFDERRGRMRPTRWASRLPQECGWWMQLKHGPNTTPHHTTHTHTNTRTHTQTISTATSASKWFLSFGVLEPLPRACVSVFQRVRAMK